MNNQKIWSTFHLRRDATSDRRRKKLDIDPSTPAMAAIAAGSRLGLQLAVAKPVSVPRQLAVSASDMLPSGHSSPSRDRSDPFVLRWA